MTRASGRGSGITCRQCMQGGELPILGSMVWVRLPAEARAPVPDLWKKLAGEEQL